MLKKICLRSVSAGVFLSALSTIAPSYGMDEIKEIKEESTNQYKKKSLTLKKTQKILSNKATPSNEWQSTDCLPSNNQKCYFATRNLPSNVARIIFSYLDPKSEGEARLVCKNWTYLCNKNREFLIKWFDSDETWTSEPQEFVRRIFSHPALFWRMLDHLNPLGLPHETKSMRGKMIVESVKSSSQLQEKLQGVLSKTGKILGFLGENNTFNYESISKVIKNVKNHPSLHQHLKALWLLNQREKEKETVENFSNAFEDSLPYNQEFRKKGGVLTKTEELDPEFEWFLEQPFWAAYTDNPITWASLFKLYDELRIPSSQAEQIYILYSQTFSWKTKFSEIMRNTLCRIYDLENELEKQINIYKGTSFFSINDLLTLVQVYHHSNRYKEAINLFELTLKNFKEKKIDIEDQVQNSFHLYICTDYLQTILKSNIYSEYKEKAFEILKDFQQATENTGKLKLSFGFMYEKFKTTEMQDYFYKDIEKKEVLFYENCLKFLFEEKSILNCLNEGANLEIVRDMITHAGLEKFSKEALELQKFFKEKSDDVFSDTGKCEGSLRTDQLNHKDVKKWLSFGKLLFSNDEKIMEGYKKLVPELFQNEKEKK